MSRGRDGLDQSVLSPLYGLLYMNMHVFCNQMIKTRTAIAKFSILRDNPKP